MTLNRTLQRKRIENCVKSTPLQVIGLDQNEINVQSISQLREYLTLLVENGLIEYEGGQTYRTTDKGMRVLHLQNEMDEVAPINFIKV